MHINMVKIPVDAILYAEGVTGQTNLKMGGRTQEVTDVTSHRECTKNDSDFLEQSIYGCKH